jgi:hypothetical protein
MANFVEHYELTERIKQVNGASWWRGWDGKLERDVSIWTLPIADPRVLKLQASASAAANLQDPRVLRVLDIVKNQTHFAVISEWVQGVTVAERVLGRAPLKDAVEIVSSVIECLSSAHAQQVFHGAVGADDVIITNAGIKIRGFGIAGVLTESFGITAEAADIAAVGAIGYAAVTATWPLLTASTLPAAPSVNGVVVLPSQLTPKLAPLWDDLVQQTVPTVNSNLDPNLKITDLAELLKSTLPKSKFAQLPTIDLPPSTITRNGLIGSLVVIASLLVAGSALVFTSLIDPTAINQGPVVQTGTDLRTELLPVASVQLIKADEAAKTVDITKVINMPTGFGLQIKLKERRTVQRVELDLNINGVDLTAQVSSTAITSPTAVGVLGEITEAASSVIIFGPRFVTGEYVTIWFTIPAGTNLQISRVGVYGALS